MGDKFTIRRKHDGGVRILTVQDCLYIAAFSCMFSWLQKHHGHHDRAACQLRHMGLVSQASKTGNQKKNGFRGFQMSDRSFRTVAKGEGSDTIPEDPKKIGQLVRLLSSEAVSWKWSP